MLSGLGSLPGKTKTSWLPSVSITYEQGGSQSMDSFDGPSDQVSGAGTAGIWTAGASLSSNSKGKGWAVEGGVSTPGASVGGQGSTTTLLTKKSALPIHVRIKAQSDATSVIF